MIITGFSLSQRFADTMMILWLPLLSLKLKKGSS